jgi:hypothetical protein
MFVQAAVAALGLSLGSWQGTFDEAGAKLELAQADGGVRVAGTLVFQADGGAWRVVEPRDAV